MKYSIGDKIGAMVAHFENDLAEDPYSLDALQRLALASEVFRNFSMGGLPGFQQEFDQGYDAVRVHYPELAPHVGKPKDESLPDVTGPDFSTGP